MSQSLCERPYSCIRHMISLDMFIISPKNNFSTDKVLYTVSIFRISFVSWMVQYVDYRKSSHTCMSRDVDRHMRLSQASVF